MNFGENAASDRNRVGQCYCGSSLSNVVCALRRKVQIQVESSRAAKERSVDCDRFVRAEKCSGCPTLFSLGSSVRKNHFESEFRQL